MKTVIILRGISGSGKSSFVGFLKGLYPQAVECSADRYFLDSSGNYSFNKEKLKDAHEFCFNIFRQYISREEPVVIVDNTNTMIWEFKKYKELAENLGYQVFVLIVDKMHNGNNVHYVPDNVVESQSGRFELGFQTKKEKNVKAI